MTRETEIATCVAVSAVNFGMAAFWDADPFIVALEVCVGVVALVWAWRQVRAGPTD